MSDYKHPVSPHSSKDPEYQHGPYGGKNTDTLSNQAGFKVFPPEKEVKARPKK